MGKITIDLVRKVCALAPRKPLPVRGTSLCPASDVYARRVLPAARQIATAGHSAFPAQPSKLLVPMAMRTCT